MNPQKKNELSHKIAVLANLMIGALDDICITSDIASDFRKKCEELLPYCEDIVSAAFVANQIRSTPYISDLSNKVDTVIRRNYQKITE